MAPGLRAGDARLSEVPCGRWEDWIDGSWLNKKPSDMGKPWENHGKTMGKPWENHGKTMGKPWENGDLYSNYVWLVEHDWIMTFPSYWECHHPN